jgi:hypothetical protein
MPRASTVGGRRLLLAINAPSGQNRNVARDFLCRGGRYSWIGEWRVTLCSGVVVNPWKGVGRRTGRWMGSGPSCRRVVRRWKVG